MPALMPMGRAYDREAGRAVRRRVGQTEAEAVTTALLVEVRGSGIHWMEPRDLPVAAIRQAGLSQGANDVEGANVAFADTSVRTLSPSLTDDEIAALLSPAGDAKRPTGSLPR